MNALIRIHRQTHGWCHWYDPIRGVKQVHQKDIWIFFVVMQFFASHFAPPHIDQFLPHSTCKITVPVHQKHFDSRIPWGKRGPRSEAQGLGNPWKGFGKVSWNRELFAAKRSWMDLLFEVSWVSWIKFLLSGKATRPYFAIPLWV